MKKIDIAGKKFNRWNVLSYEGNGNYLCICDCGTERLVNGHNVKNGKTKSCGCYRDEKKSSTSTKVIIKCKFCHKEKKVSFCHKHQKFCSVECKAKSTYQTKKCLICEKEFILSKKSKKEYCSQKCANAPKIQKFIEKADRTTYACKNCKKKRTVLNSLYRKKNFKFVFCSVKCKSEFHKKTIEKKCLCCEKKFIPKHTRQFLCSLECSGVFRRGKKKSEFWMENGYKVLSLGDGKGIKEHIKNMQDHIGRDLKKNECVHHINENKLDNRIENLQLMTKSNHAKLEPPHG